MLVKVEILAGRLQGSQLVVAHRHATSELLWLVETFQQPIIRCQRYSHVTSALACLLET